MAVINLMLLRIFDEAKDERRYAHDSRRVQPLNCIPLQFRNTVANTDDAGAHSTNTEPIGQTCHKALVDGCHQLQDIPFMQPGAFKGLMLIVRQALQVGFRTAEQRWISERSGGSDIIDDVLFRDAQEIIIELL